MSLRIQEEPFSKWCREAVPLFEDHWREVGVDRDKIVLSIDFERLFQLERARALSGFTARVDGALVGYALFLVAAHLHYKQAVFAYADVIYVAPEHRKTTGAGLGLMRLAERTLRNQGVAKIVYHIKLDHDFMPVMRKLGYEERERMVEKVLI